MSLPIPHWRFDRAYYPTRDPRRSDHVAHIDVQERINQRIVASSADGSYAATVTKRDVAK